MCISVLLLKSVHCNLMVLLWTCPFELVSPCSKRVTYHSLYTNRREFLKTRPCHNDRSYTCLLEWTVSTVLTDDSDEEMWPKLMTDVESGWKGTVQRTEYQQRQWHIESTLRALVAEHAPLGIHLSLHRLTLVGSNFLKKPTDSPYPQNSTVIFNTQTLSGFWQKPDKVCFCFRSFRLQGSKAVFFLFFLFHFFLKDTSL